MDIIQMTLLLLRFHLWIFLIVPGNHIEMNISFLDLPPRIGYFFLDTFLHLTFGISFLLDLIIRQLE